MYKYILINIKRSFNIFTTKIKLLTKDEEESKKIQQEFKAAMDAFFKNNWPPYIRAYIIIKQMVPQFYLFLYDKNDQKVEQSNLELIEQLIHSDKNNSNKKFKNLNHEFLQSMRQAIRNRQEKNNKKIGEFQFAFKYFKYSFTNYTAVLNKEIISFYKKWLKILEILNHEKIELFLKKGIIHIQKAISLIQSETEKKTETLEIINILHIDILEFGGKKFENVSQMILIILCILFFLKYIIYLYIYVALKKQYSKEYSYYIYLLILTIFIYGLLGFYYDDVNTFNLIIKKVNEDKEENFKKENFKKENLKKTCTKINTRFFSIIGFASILLFLFFSIHFYYILIYESILNKRIFIPIYSFLIIINFILAAVVIFSI